ncbi:MAG TPA: tetratricopeptide repeat protein [Myxococcales bacterium]
MKPLVLVRALPLPLLLCACSSVAVRVPAVKPAEINLAAYQSVGIGAVTGSGNFAVADALEDALTSSQRFQVVDRVHMGQLLKELQLTPADLQTPKGTAKLAKLVADGALIFGETTERFSEVPNRQDWKDEQKNTHVLNTLKGEVYVRATFKVVDIASGRLIVAKTYEERRQDLSQNIDKRPDPVDRHALEVAARQAIVMRFMRAIVPHTEYQEAGFRKDSDLPQFEGGIGHAQRGEWKEAEAAFSAALQDAEQNKKLKSSTLAKCYWNLGLTYEYAGDYDKASELLGKAYKLSNDEAMLPEIDNVKRLQSDSRRLPGQLSANAGSGK